ncbi:hypothetical protein EDD85DRAFT_955472 [Armillaria nabsnona]|nr:hypothetical protein EDD85DRAFT_955472 [Armillaria nabsnona]
MYLFGPEGLLILLRLSDHDNDDGEFAVNNINGLPTGLVIKVKMFGLTHFLQNMWHALGTGYFIGIGLNSVLGCDLSVPSSNAQELFLVEKLWLVEGFALDRDEMPVGMVS